MLGKLGDGRAERSPRAGNEEIMLPGPAGEAYLVSGLAQKELPCSCMTSQQAAGHLRIQSTAQFSMAQRMQQTSPWFT